MSSLLPGLANAPDIHPLFVHFPIALWLVAAMLYTVGVLRDSERARDSGRLLLYLGTAAALLTLLTGFRAAGRLGHDSVGHDLVHTHRNLMIAATAAAVLASGLARAAKQTASKPLAAAAAATLLVCAALTGLGADRGANLVFGWGVGVAETPPASDVADVEGHKPAGHGGHAH